MSEVKDYLNPGTKFKFIPDSEIFEKVELNVDFTVATPCACKYFIQFFVDLFYNA